MKFLYSLAGWLSLVGCSAAELGKQSQLQHDLGRITNEASAWQWQNVSREDFIRTSLMGDDKSNALPADHELTKRVQFWLSAIDMSLRLKSPSDLAAVPSPVALIVKNKEANAFVSQTPVCLNLRVLFDSEDSAVTAAPDTPPAEKIALDRAFFEFRKAADECLDTQMSRDEQTAFIDWYMRPYPECRYSVKGEEITFSGSCGVNAEDPLPRGTRSKKLVLYRTPPYISFYSGILSMMSEDEFVTVAAHELGHYYMGHVTSPRSAYGFYYRLGNDNPGGKPEADKTLTSLVKEMDAAVKAQAAVPALKTVAGQKFDSHLFIFTRALMPTFRDASCKDQAACNNPCTDLAEVLNGPGGPIFEAFPFFPLPEKANEAYSKYETLLAQCLPLVPIVDQDSVMLFVKQSFSDDDLFERWLEPVPSSNTADELWGFLNVAIPRAVAKRNASFALVFQKAIDVRLGYYTQEQEADELALEWTHDLGIDPRKMIDAEIKFGKEMDAAPDRKARVYGELDGTQCEALYKNDWKDREGHPVFVPIADYADLHHSSCFRAFNAAREIDVHDLRHWSDHNRPQPVSPSWDVIASLAQEVGQAVMKGGTFSLLEAREP